MIAAVIAGLLISTVAGLPIARALDASSRGARLAAESFLFGSGTAAMSLYVLTLAGIRWSLPAALLIVFTVAAIALRRTRRRSHLPLHTSRRPGGWSRVATAFPDAMCGVLVGGYALWATSASPWHADYWVIWGMKARAFLAHGGIDWEHLRSPYNFWTHPDYPPQLPLFYDFLQLFQSGWDDRWLGLVSVAFAVASLVVLRSAVEEATGSSAIAAWTTLAGTLPALNVFVGMAEPPLMAYATAGLLLVSRAVVTNDQASFRSGAVLLGFAALTKNEGLALLVAVTFALAVSTRNMRIVVRLWPAWVLAASWQVVRLSHGLSTDLFAGAVSARLIPDAERIRQVLAALTTYVPAHRVFWLALLVALVLGWRAVLRERFLVVTLLVQLIFYVGAYLATPHDIAWHAGTSWTRLLIQIAIPMTALAGFSIAELMHPRAEAGARRGLRPAAQAAVPAA